MPEVERAGLRRTPTATSDGGRSWLDAMEVMAMEGMRCLRGAVLLVLCLAGVFTPEPAGAQIYWVEASHFAPPNTGCRPEFGDLDGDADYDLIYATVLHSYRNAGTPEVPSWQRDDSLIAGVEYVNAMTACLSDLDADGDLDLSVGQLYGEVWPVLYYRNEGSPAQPVWQEDNSMYETLPLYGYTHPELADLDADGDFDLVVSSQGHFEAYRNTGTPVAAAWTEDESLIDGIVPPWGLGLVDQNFGDLDGDGDLDVILGSRSGDGHIMCFENTGTGQVPAWAENESLLIGVDRFVESWGLELADIDADGDLDLLVVIGDMDPVLYLNGGPITPVEPSSWGRIKGLFRER
jgi:hypothetical protein